MLRKTFIAALSFSVLAGCDWDSLRPGDRDDVLVTLSVAQQVLGSEAVSLNPFLGTQDRIVTPGIYNIRTGEPKQICPRDTRAMVERQEMQVEPDKVLEIIEDVRLDATIKVNVWGTEWAYPYQTLRVSGYEISRVLSPDHRSADQYILESVGPKCRDDVLPFNKPYVVVTAVATADKVETVTGGSDLKVVFGIGPASFEGQLAPYVDLEREDRVFAVSGRVVEADQSQ